LFGRAASGEF